jgi:hypothetical protein
LVVAGRRVEGLVVGEVGGGEEVRSEK